MVHAELYLQAGDVESVVAHVKQVQTNKKHSQDGMAEIMGMATAELGRFWEGDDLMNAFYGRCLRNEKVVEQVISTAKKLLAAGYNGRKPIIKLFLANITWLVTGIEDGYLYGYGDIGQGCVGWGSLTNVEELPTLRNGPFYMERDRHWTPKEGVNYTELDSLSGI